MKRSTEQTIKNRIKCWKHLQALIETYRKSDDVSHTLVTDLEKLAKTYEKDAFRALIDE